MSKCDTCKERCPQAELAHQAALGRMYATNEFIALLKKIEKQPVTNADRIRAMTDEELCEFLSQYKFCDICEEGCSDCTYHGDCDKRLLDWLQQPAEGDV